MEDLQKAGGLAAVLRELKPFLHLDALTVTGRTLGEELEAAGPGFPQDVVRSRANPIYPQGGIAVLRGNLAPGGAIINQSAAGAALMEHEGRVVAFEGLDDLAPRASTTPNSMCAPTTCWCSRTSAPRGCPACPRPVTSRFRASSRARA